MLSATGRQTLPAMEEARRMGKIRLVGLTGFPLAIHKEMIDHCPKGVKIDTCASRSWQFLAVPQLLAVQVVT
jgi:diketogulonate reductase-like aldo/keto reductase